MPGKFKKRMKEKGSMMAQAHRSRNKPEMDDMQQLMGWESRQIIPKWTLP